MLDIFKLEKDHKKKMVIELGEMDPLRFVQYQQWHDVLIAGPTRNVVGNPGNDFPGLYYYDPTTRREHVMMFQGIVDFSSCFLGRRIHKDADGKSFLELGLFSEQGLSEGITFEHWSRDRAFPQETEGDPRDAMPDQWDGLQILMEKSFELMPLQVLHKTYNWSHAAETCLNTLNRIRKQEYYEHDKSIYVFFETFSSGKDSYGRTVENARLLKGTAELICQAGLASALLAYADENPKYAVNFKKLGLELTSTLKHFFDPKTNFFQNTFPPRGEEWTRRVVDTWYSFHNLYHVMRAAYYANDDELINLAIQAIERAIQFVKACNYQIPLFAKIGLLDKKGQEDDGQVIGYALNPSVLGMYAKCLVFATNLEPAKEDSYFDEAQLALKLLRRYPLNTLFHQTLQLSWAASAAHELGNVQWREDFTRCLLLSCYRSEKHAGLFQGCAGLNYPSFRETVESVEFWPEWLNEVPKNLPLENILCLVLTKAQNFLVQKSNLKCLPNEGLSTFEQPDANKIGVASYAAPQVYELARLQLKYNL